MLSNVTAGDTIHVDAPCRLLHLHIGDTYLVRPALYGCKLYVVGVVDA